MPIFELNTNIPISSFEGKAKGESFLTKTSKIIAEILGKPEMYVAVHVNAGQMMSFGGSTDPCAVVNLFSIGVKDEMKKTLVTRITKHLMEDCGLNIPPDRMYIHIQDVTRTDMGWNNKTFG